MPVKHGTQKRNLKLVRRRISFPVRPEHVERLTTPISAYRLEKLRDEAELKDVLATAYECWTRQPAAKFLADYDTNSPWKDLALQLALLTLPALKSFRPAFLRRGRNPVNDRGSTLSGLPIGEQDARWLVKAVECRSQGQSVRARCEWLKNNPTKAQCPSDYLSAVKPRTMANHYGKARRILEHQVE
jgi:hypothetical protein